jgi:flavin reductase (DIM6/NTAB) family NADH-FMN oxidoreductase RutF
MIYFDLATGHPSLQRDPFKAIVAPRPIGWISSLDAEGRPNLAPYSYFNAIGENPAMVMFSSAGMKHSLSNILATGEFVCNLATWDLREQVNATSAGLAAGESEFDFAGLTPAPCVAVKPPRVAESPAALECVLLRTVQLEDRHGRAVKNFVVFGEVVGVHLDERVIVDGRVDPGLLNAITRLGGPNYSVARPDTIFAMQRPPGGGG